MSDRLCECPKGTNEGALVGVRYDTFQFMRDLESEIPVRST